MYHHLLCNHIYQLWQKEYEKQVLLVCVKEYVNIIEDKRTAWSTMNEKENAWDAIANKYADANVTKRTRKQLKACWKKREKNTHKNLDASDRKEWFRTSSGPAAVPDDPIAQTIGDILQRRSDPLPNPYDDDADPHDKTHPFLVSYIHI